MPVNINLKARKRRWKLQAVLGIVFFGLLLLAVAGVFVSLCFIPGLPGWLTVLFAALALFSILPMGFALVVLIQRFKEIEGGEYDAAAEY